MSADLLATMRAAADAATRPPGQRCVTCRLPPEIRAALDVFHAEGKLAPYMAAAVKAAGHQASEGSIRRHYRVCVP